MLLKLFKSSAIACATIFAANAGLPAQAWNDVGHMTVAGIAYKHLNPSTKAKCDALMKLNPYYGEWMSGLPAKMTPEEKNMLIFMLVSTWPDVIKGDRTFSVDGGGGGYKPEGAVATRNIGYEDHLLHKYWHFVDYPFSGDGTPLPTVPSPNAETEILDFSKALSSDKSESIKSYDLTWLIHLVGDIHQPLHCVTRVTKIHPDGDAGGNQVKIHTTDGDGNLHACWDNMLGMNNEPYHVLRLVNRLSPSTGKSEKLKTEASASRQAEEVHAWCLESAKYARDEVYRKPIGANNGPFFVDKRYKRKSAVLARKQVEKAGMRLAGLLNQSLH